MSVPDRPELRISDTDRDRAVARLNEAVAEGRLTLAEFEERVDRIMQARTTSEMAPYLADLPSTDPVAPTAPEHGDVRATMSSLKRSGRWVVPRRLTVQSKAGSVRLDLTEAVVAHPVVDLELEVFAGSTTLILPRGASVDADRVEVVASTVKVHEVPAAAEPVGQPHFVISGKQWAGSLTVRYQRRFLWWRW